MGSGEGDNTPGPCANKLPMRRTQWIKRLGAINVRLAFLRRKLSQLEEVADATMLECKDLVAEVETSTGAWLDAGSSSVLQCGNRRCRKSGKAFANVLKQMASEGVSFLSFSRFFDGYAKIRINSAKPFTLAPAMADLLFALVSDKGRGEDGSSAWKTKEEVALILSTKTGNEVKRHSVNQRIFRLREILEYNNINPYFVQTNRAHGEVRFALKRDAVVTFTSESSVAAYDAAINS
jgi:hypothetical protein